MQCDNLKYLFSYRFLPSKKAFQKNYIFYESRNKDYCNFLEFVEISTLFNFEKSLLLNNHQFKESQTIFL